jgi:CheY-like chemotaxis protein/HPt (histidine-containing phosphotransfer) domain-containing protein
VPGVVLIERGRRRRPRLAAADLVMVDGEAMHRSVFLQAVAIAAGRAPEDAEAPSAGKSAAALAAPARADALSAGRLILVAEDNATNQKVIVQQLALLGFAADIANDGREALARWHGTGYGLLLTDLHMPEMDGYELTAAIRAEERDGQRLPIVALTANALRGEALHCLDAGMDDYLSKPTPLTELKAMMEKWLPAVAATGAARDSAAVSPAPTFPGAVDVGVLAALVGDDPATIREFLVDFRASATAIAAELSAACAAGDAARAGALAHKLKSSARSVGALALGELCAEIEAAGKSAAVGVLGALHARFAVEMAAVDAALDELTAQPDTPDREAPQ